MFTIPNRPSLPKAYTQFSGGGRLSTSGNPDRLVDRMEKPARHTRTTRPNPRVGETDPESGGRGGRRWRGKGLRWGRGGRS